MLKQRKNLSNQQRHLLHLNLLGLGLRQILLDRVVEDGLDPEGVHPVDDRLDGGSVLSCHKVAVKRHLHQLGEQGLAKDGLAKLHQLKIDNRNYLEMFEILTAWAI